MSAARRTRTVLAFDYGGRRIGVAVGEELTGNASGLDTILASESGPDWDAIGRHVAEWQPALFVVGLPHNADGTPGTLTAATRRFCAQLRERFGIAVEVVDERLTSAEAEQRLREQRRSGARRRRVRKADVDRLAAELILQSWLERHADNDAE